MEIFKSATKLVFVIMAVATIALTFLGIVEAKDFIMLVTGVFSYYFGRNKATVQNNLG